MKKLFVFILLAFLLMFCATPVYAGPPTLPHAFYGNVTINGAAAPDGTQISATVENGTIIPTQNPVTTVGDSYGIGNPKLLVQGDDLSGAITFYVNGHEATPSQAVTFEAGGGPTQLDLSVTATLPSVLTSAATSVTTTRATLNGNLASLGTALSLDVSFEWGGTETTTQTMSSTGPFNFSLSGLSPGTTYYFRAKADGGVHGISYGDVRSFTTLTISPRVTTNDATSVTTTSAGLNGSLDSLGTASSVAVSFEWGETTDYGNTATVTASPLSQAGAFNASLSGLIRGTTYHFRVKAVGDGTSYGADRAFTTLTTPPVVTIGAVTTPTNVATQTLSGTMEEGTTVALTADTAATFGEVTYSTSTTWSCEVTLVEGSNEITAAAADAVGNEGTATTTIVLDTIAPSVTIGAVTTPTDVVTQALTGTMEEGATVALTSAAATFGDVSYDTTTWSCEVTLVEGLNEITATATDAVGNEGTATTTIVLDTLAPVVEITSPLADALLNSLEVTIEGTATEVAEVVVDGQTAAVVDGTFSVVLTLTEGANSVTATATDATGNVGSDTVGFNIDVTAPVVTIGAVTTPTDVVTQALTGTMEEGTTVALTADTAATFGAVTNPTTTTWSCEVTLVEGLNEITATATDAVGNEGTATTTIVLDTTAPSVTIGAVTTPTDVATQALSGTMEEGTTVALTSTEATFGEVTYPTTTTWSCDVSLVEGSNEITATATDAAGNEGTATTTIVLDTIAPVVEITSPLQGALLNSLEVTIEGTATEVAEVLVDGQTAPVVDGTFSVVLTLIEGANSVTATATDATGNVGSDTIGFNIDITAPSVTIGAVTTPTDVATQTLRGTREEGTTVALTSTEATFAAVSYPTTTTWSCEVTLVEGSNEVTATATDAVGNEGTATTTIVLDTIAPSVTIGAVTTPTDVVTQALTGTMEDGATVALTSTEATFGAVTYPTTTTWSCEVTLVEGSNEITATATDAVGNEATATTTIVLDTAVDEIPPAQITDLAANAGSPATTRVILGWTAPGDDGNTGTATSYEIRRSTSEITNANWSSATVIYNNIVPQAAGGLESFVVSRLTADTSYYFAIQAKDEVGNASPTSNSPSVTTEANLPTIIDISPTSGQNSQAWTLTIDGNNFVDGTNVVRFVSGDNTFDLTNVTYASSTRLTADVAKGAPTGTYRARVINDNGTSELSSVTYEVTEAPVPLPVVTNLIPQMAASDSAVSDVQIFGENLAGATGVSFGGTTTSNVMVISDTKITVDVPGLSAGEYDVKVTTPAGTNEISGVKFMVSDPLTITEDTTEDTTTSEVVKLDTNVIPVQLTLTTDTSETATQATDADVEIEVTIPPQTTVTCEGEPYVGNINPPRVVKPDESVLTDLSDDAVVIEMGNPEKTINFDQDFVATVIITTPAEPVIWYYNMTTQSYELAGKTGTKDGVNYVPGGTKLGQENSTYTMGLLLDQMSLYVAGVKPDITSTPATVTAGSAFTITGTNFHPTGAEVYFNGAVGTIVSRSSTTEIVARFPTAGSYTLKVENPDKLSDTTSITLTTPPLPLTVTTTSPAADATGVAITTVVTATFSEAIDEATLSFTLEGVDGSVTYSDTTATFTPSANLGYSTIYTASIQASDLAGNPMAEAHTWSFTTRAKPAPGAPPTPPAPPPGTTDVSGMVSEAGVFQESATATSDDGLCTLTIPEGTVGLTEELEPLDEITVVIMDEPPAPPEDAHVVGLAYDLGPDGATFEPPITLTFSYDPDALPEGIAEKDLVLAYYDEAIGEWVELDGVVDTVNNTITASVAHFTTFAIIGTVPAPPPPPAPARFTIRSLGVSPSEVAPGEEVTISVLVANTGGKLGSYTVVLKINGVKEAEERVTVAAGRSRTVSFSVTKEEADSYTVTVDGLSGSFTVVPVVVPPEPAAFSVSYLSVSPRLEVEAGEPVAITVLVANTGGKAGSYTIVLKINGVKEAEETVTIAAGEGQDVSFSVTREEAGSYTVAVDGLSGSFTVVAPPEEEEEEEEVPIEPGINWPLFGGIIAAVVIVAGLLIYVFVFRRRAY